MIREKLEEILLSVEKPAQYVGGELGSIVKSRSDVNVKFAFCFPDTYEIGMSHLGMKILYGLINNIEDICCERVFSPCKDMQEKLKQNNIPLYCLESFEPVKDFDIIGFSMQYELSYNNILNILDLSGIELLKENRKGIQNIVIAGGPCTCNPEPMADFIDIFFLGEAEENIIKFIDLYRIAKKENWDKEKLLQESSKIEGIYIPELYEVKYNQDGTIESITSKNDAIIPVKKAIINNLNSSYYPENFVVPFVDIVHDRAVIEIMRGCIRGCRFCQAGYIYRPLREKSKDILNNNARELCQNTGYDEISVSSLSTSDYSEIQPLLENMLDWSIDDKVSLSLPSLRVDNFSEELLDKIKLIRKTGLTFAPEAGTQRLRDVINKNVTDEEIMRTCRMAFEGGYSQVKLYFMLGLPTETKEDLDGILNLAKNIVDLYYSISKKERRISKKAFSVNISVSTFVPKPFTPFEFEPQDTKEEIIKKQEYLKINIPSKKISLSYHSVNTSVLEAVLARGDRRLGKVILKAYEKGCFFDSWDEHFKYNTWLEVFEECGIDIGFYANRKREYSEISPWSHIDYYVDKEFLIKENKLAHKSITSPNCKQKCLNCGVNKKAKEGICFERC